MNRFTYADILRDLGQGLLHWRIWSALSFNSTKMMYRRALLGPLWLTLQQTVFIGALGYVFASIQNQDFPGFFVYIATGLTFWQLITAYLTTAGNTFAAINRFPSMTCAAFSNHIYLQFLFQFLLFMHRLLPALVICGIFHESLAINLPNFLAGFAALLVFGFWISALLGCLSLRFHDLMPAVGSIMQVMFFLTPVMYRDSAISGAGHFFNLNPLNHFLLVTRGSLLGENVSAMSWATVVVINIVGIVLTLGVLRWARPKIPLWV